MPDPEVVVLLLLAAGFAGWVDAVSGGGGLVQLPALLIALPGASPAAVLATNKLSSICGTSAAALTYHRRVRPDLRTALPMAGFALVGSALGALLASQLPRSVFTPVVLVLLVAVAAFTALNQAFVAVLGTRRGWVYAIAFTAAQAVALGGPIPIDTAPAPVQLLHAVLPVPRAADGLAALTLGGQVGSPWADAAVVLMWGAAGLVATAVAVRRRQRLTPDEVRRSVEEPARA